MDNRGRFHRKKITNLRAIIFSGKKMGADRAESPGM
jgi:hypothetical protein